MLIAIILIAALLFLAVRANATGLGGSMRLTPSQIAQYASDAGFEGDDLTTAVAIAMAESNVPATNPATGNTEAIGDSGDSIGLWQIDTRFHPEFDRNKLTDPQYNAEAAFDIYTKARGSFQPWSTYNSGKYFAFLSDAQTGAESL